VWEKVFWDFEPSATPALGVGLSPYTLSDTSAGWEPCEGPPEAVSIPREQGEEKVVKRPLEAT